MKIFPRLFLYTISEHSFTNVRLLEENGNREHFFTNVRLLEENGNLHRNRKSKQLKFFLNSECKCLTFNKLFWALKPYFFFFYFVILTHGSCHFDVKCPPLQGFGRKWWLMKGKWFSLVILVSSTRYNVLTNSPKQPANNLFERFRPFEDKPSLVDVKHQSIRGENRSYIKRRDSL